MLSGTVAKELYLRLRIGDWPGMKILVVDDERPTADQIADLLRKHEHCTLSLYSPADALKHLRHIWFDLVILDMRSAELAERILEAFLHPEVLLLDTTDTSEELVSKVKQVEQQLELERQQVFDFLQSGYGEDEPCTPDQ